MFPLMRVQLECRYNPFQKFLERRHSDIITISVGIFKTLIHVEFVLL